MYAEVPFLKTAAFLGGELGVRLLGCGGDSVMNAPAGPTAVGSVADYAVGTVKYASNAKTFIERTSEEMSARSAVCTHRVATSR